MDDSQLLKKGSLINLDKPRGIGTQIYLYSDTTKIFKKEYRYRYIKTNTDIFTLCYASTGQMSTDAPPMPILNNSL